MKREDRENGMEPSKKKVKKTNKLDEASCKATEFKGYDLSELPHEALPIFGAEYKGQHSYTVNLGGAVSGLCSINTLNMFHFVCL